MKRTLNKLWKPHRVEFCGATKNIDGSVTKHPVSCGFIIEWFTPPCVPRGGSLQRSDTINAHKALGMETPLESEVCTPPMDTFPLPGSEGVIFLCISSSPAIHVFPCGFQRFYFKGQSASCLVVTCWLRTVPGPCLWSTLATSDQPTWPSWY